MQLTRRQKLDFHQQGYLKISDAVPNIMVAQSMPKVELPHRPAQPP
jgi:hypothetical protein